MKGRAGYSKAWPGGRHSGFSSHRHGAQRAASSKRASPNNQQPTHNITAYIRKLCTRQVTLEGTRVGSTKAVKPGSVQTVEAGEGDGPRRREDEEKRRKDGSWSWSWPWGWGWTRGRAWRQRWSVVKAASRVQRCTSSHVAGLCHERKASNLEAMRCDGCLMTMVGEEEMAWADGAWGAMSWAVCALRLAQAAARCDPGPWGVRL